MRIMTCDKVSKARTRSDRKHSPPRGGGEYAPTVTGFTLLEVLVSLSILGMIATVAFAGLSIGIDSWRRGSQRIEDLDRRFAVERLLQRQIALSDSHIFRGDNRQLEFSTSYSLANGPGDPVWVKYVIGTNEFMYSETPFAQFAPENPTEQLKQTFSGLTTTGFRYLYTGPGGQREWMNTSMDAPPVAVQIGIAGDVLTIPLLNTQ